MMMMTVQRQSPKNKKPMTTRRRSPSFFINIGISQPKMRIQVPKLLQRPRKDHDEAKKPGKTLPKKMLSILSSVFGSKKSVSHSKSESEVGQIRWFKGTRKGSGKCVYCGIKTVGAGSQVSLCKPHSLLKAFQADDDPREPGTVPTISRQESSRKLARVSSRVSSRRRMRRVRSVRKKVDKEREDDDEEEREENNELCQKRILMGGRCKPVDFSESLDFDYFSGDRYKRHHS